MTELGVGASAVASAAIRNVRSEPFVTSEVAPHWGDATVMMAGKRRGCREADVALGHSK